ncbi:MAG: ComEC/Rec2 family competence protein [Candidatus Portnoybacteria bacterium]|nr:ComEC/Rec2 family competence protein [Candidatus Portnoybacteria bacterium]MDD4982604.1 ComEC/Rec2 family competence protein [Candidatus Portnoybacteria bacterium]
MSNSKIFLFFCLSFIFGVFVQSVFNFPRPVWLGFLILGVMLAAMFWGRAPKIVIAGFCLMIMAGGAWRYISVSDTHNLIKQFNDKGKITITGVISEEPDVRSDNIKYKVSVKGVWPFDSGYASASASASPLPLQATADKQGTNLGGNILVVAKKYPAYQYGDKLEITGKLKTPSVSDDFDYKSYLAKEDIYSIAYFPEMKLLAQGRGNWLMTRLLFVKNKFSDSIGRVLTEPQAAFLAGLILGEKRGLPQDIMDAFSRTGTTHIIALSGFNITIIAVALMNLFNFFMVRRQISFWLSVGAIILFVLMTGAAASVVRAAVMGILVLLAQQVGRLYQIRNALVLAGAIMVYLNPRVLVWDLGFQLSFAATLGLIYTSPILQNWFIGEKEREDGNKKILGLKEILIATLAAQIAVLPLLIINFGQLSLIAPLANILVLPFIPATMFFGFLSALVGLAILPLGKVLGWLAWLFLTYEIRIIELLAKLPLAAVNFKWTWLGGGLYYAVLIWLVWKLNKTHAENSRSPTA